MLIEDPRAFTLIVPNHNGTAFLRRALDYLAAEGYRGALAVADSSAPEAQAQVRACAGQYPGLRIDLQTYPSEIGFFDKLAATLERLESRAVMVCANDDYVMLDALEGCVEMLEADSGLAVARGRHMMFEMQQGAEAAAAPEWRLRSYPMRAYAEADPFERLLGCVNQYSTTFNSVHRRELLLEATRATIAGSENMIFVQYLLSVLGVVQGKVACVDELFYVRQGHAKSTSAQARAADYEHWPLLITHPRFTEYYQRFRVAVASFYATRATLPLDFETRFDEAAVGLMIRGYCGHESDNFEEVRFLERSRDRASPEYARVDACAKFTARYPDTY
ncbi:MAG: TIGR00180 family glycosyltransferase [Burkholderiales bacterium]